MSVSNTWFYETNGQRSGPVSLQVIRSLSRKGVITKTTLVSDGSQNDWVPFSHVEGQLTVSTVATAPSPAPIATPTTATGQQGSVPMFSPAAGQSATSVSTAPGQHMRSGVTGFGEAISICFSKYFMFSGRANRAEYWYFQLFALLVNLLLALVIGLSATAISTIAAIVPLIMLIFQLALFIPLLSVSVRRLHDTDKTGWWLLIGLVPIVGFIVLIVFFIQRGTLVANRYG